MNDYKELWYDWMGGNDVVFQAVNSIHGGPVYDKVMKAVSVAADYHYFPAYLIGLLAWCTLFYVIKSLKNTPGTRFYFSMWLGVFVMLLVGFAVNGAVVKEIKNHLSYPRPYIALASTGQVHQMEESEPENDFKSFPSGHVSFATFLVVTLWPVLGNAMALLGVIFILLVGWSRMALGMHFPMDVIGAILITAPLIAILRYFVYTALRKVFRLKC